MTNFNCNCNRSGSPCICTGLSVIASIIVGLLTGFLTFSATITVGTSFLWVAFGIAVVYLLVLALGAAHANGNSKACICYNLPFLIVGILGTILTSLVLLAVGFAATSVIGAIITGLLLLFFTLTITQTACLSACLADCDDEF